MEDDLSSIVYEDRRETVRTLVANGLSMREAGRRVGLSHQRVHQIVQGEDNPPVASFPGSKRDYKSAHHLVARRRGTPKLCDECGTTDAERYEWANLTGDFRNVHDYKRMCLACHRAHDTARGAYVNNGRRLAA